MRSTVLRVAAAGCFVAVAAVVFAGEPSGWRLHAPVVLDAQDPPGGARRNFLWMAPAGFCQTDRGTVLVSMRGIKRSPVLDLWRETGDRTWEKAGTLEGVNWPRVFAVEGAVGVIGSVGKDASSGYGSALRFYRLADGRERFSADVCRPAADTDRLTISAVHARGKTVSVFMLREVRGDRENRLLFSRSVDGGRSWPAEPTLMARTTMHEDVSRLGSFQFSDDHLGRFVVERDGALLFYETRDGGTTWDKRTVAYVDDLGARGRRMPLGSVDFGDGVGVVYLGIDPADRRHGRYYFTRSTDKATTWEKAVAITAPVKVDDPALFVQIAAAGPRIAIAYVETTGRWTEGEMQCRLAMSEDGGATWKPQPLEKYYRGVALFSALSGSAAEKRILYATAICMDPRTNPRNYLAVQELSARPEAAAAAPTAEGRRQIAAWVEQLGDDRFAVREAATRNLVRLGQAASEELLRAAQSDDAEVAARARKVLSQSFPECIKPDPQ